MDLFFLENEQKPIQLNFNVLMNVLFNEKGIILDTDKFKANKTEKIYIFNRNISITIDNETYCNGFYDLTQRLRIPCKDTNKVSGSGKKCHLCLKKQQFNPAFYNFPKSLISVEQKERNKLPHTVYLAYFGPSVLKVGMCLSSRVMNRLLEQGARMACIISEHSNAYEAREVESLIITKGLAYENISKKNKISLLEIYKYDLEKGKSEIFDKIKKINVLLNRQSKQDDLINLQRYYFLTQEPSCVNVRHKISSVKGKIIGAIGTIIYLENNNIVSIFDISQGIGKAVVKLEEK